jgi:hypothetical protein
MDCKCPIMPFLANFWLSTTHPEIVVKADRRSIRYDSPQSKRQLPALAIGPAEGSSPAHRALRTIQANSGMLSRAPSHSEKDVLGAASIGRALDFDSIV